jgi:branched-chain amino acid transport system permease protein
VGYFMHILIIALIYAIFAVSLNIELGYTGLYNFGHVAFFGIGAYTSALLSLAGMSVFLSMACGMAAAAAAGCLLALPALRLSGDYFGIATLVFAEMVRLFFLNERWLTRGPMGLPGIPRPDCIGAGIAALPKFLLFSGLVAAAVLLIVRHVTTSPFGRALKVVREDEFVAQSLGKNVFSLKVKTVTLGSLVAGLAGAMWAHYVTYISPGDFTLTETILVLLCVVLGGRGTNWGPVLGAFLVIFSSESVRFLPIPSQFSRFVAPLQGMIYGAVLMLVMLKRPEGIIPEHNG